MKRESSFVLFCFLNRRGLNVGSRELSAGAIEKPFTLRAVVCFGSVSMATVGSVCRAEWIYRILKTLLF